MQGKYTAICNKGIFYGENDLFFTCSLIDYIARKTKNRRSAIVNKLGRTTLSKIYELADIYHSDNIDRASDDFISAAGIVQGSFDNLSIAKYAVPSHWDIGNAYNYEASGNILNAYLYGVIE